MCDSFSLNKMTIFINIAPIKFLTKSLIWHILCVDKIGSADHGILCVDKIGSPENPQHTWWPLIFSPLIRTKPSPGEDPKVGWYCYRATQSRRSHLTYTHRKSSYRPKDNIFWEKSSSPKQRLQIPPFFQNFAECLQIFSEVCRSVHNCLPACLKLPRRL